MTTKDETSKTDKAMQYEPVLPAVISDLDIETAAVKMYKGDSLIDQRRNLDKILAFEEGAKWMQKILSDNGR